MQVRIQDLYRKGAHVAQRGITSKARLGLKIGKKLERGEEMGHYGHLWIRTCTLWPAIDVCISFLCSPCSESDDSQIWTQGDDVCRWYHRFCWTLRLFIRQQHSLCIHLIRNSFR